MLESKERRPSFYLLARISIKKSPILFISLRILSNILLSLSDLRDLSIEF